MEDNLFRASEHTAGEDILFGGTIQQGMLERSNVNIVNEMVQMITISRAYETNAKMIQVQDGTLQKAVTEIARR
jgi:flagellar basal-body rod protein FlgG